jgi:hypothetical protein
MPPRPRRDCRVWRRSDAASAPVASFTATPNGIARSQGGPLVVLIVCMLSIPGSCIVGGGTGNAATPAAGDDGEVAALLSKIEEQVLAGQTMSPPHNNAIDTWADVLQMTSGQPSQRVVKALNDFVTQARIRADIERTQGHTTASVDLSVFAGLASDELKDLASPNQRPTPEAQTDGNVAQAPLAPQLTAPATETSPASTNTAAVAAGVLATAAHAETIPASPANDDPAAANYPAPKHPESNPPSAASPIPAPLSRAQPARARAANDAATAALYAERGDALLAVKDISGARKFYAFAANAGNGHAAAAMAQTYDPSFLAKLGVAGLQSDRAQAISWYEKAIALGDRSGAPRLGILQQDAAK